jgi:hypothetical protein
MANPTLVPFTHRSWVPLDPKAARLHGTVSADGGQLTHETMGGTDWWRTTERDSHDGPTLGFSRPVHRGFEVSVELDVRPRNQVS